MGKLLESVKTFKGKRLTIKPLSPMHGYIFKEPTKYFIETVTTVMRREIDFYKNRVLPTIDTSISAIQRDIEIQMNSIEYLPEIENLEIPQFIREKLEFEYKPAIDESRELNIGFSQSVNWSDIISSLDESPIKEYLSNRKESEIQKAYIQYVTTGRLKAPKEYHDYQSYRGLVIAVALFTLLNKDIKFGEPIGKLQDYRYYISNKLLQLRELVNRVTKKHIQSEKSGYLILNKIVNRVTKEVKTILVSNKHLLQFYNNGGEIETLFGAAYKLPSMVKLVDLLENGEEYTSLWSSKVITFEEKKSTSLREVCRLIYRNKLPDLTRDLKESRAIDVERFLREYSPRDITEVSEFVPAYILEYLLKDSNASLFVKHFHYYLRNIKDRKAAAKMATTRLLVDYLMQGIDVVDRDSIA